MTVRKLLLRDESTDEVFVNDMPSAQELSDVVEAFKKAGRALVVSSYEEFKPLNDEAWRLVQDMAARCIARGRRLALLQGKERKNQIEEGRE